MKQELWQKVEELFHAALERTPDARRAFLDGNCGINTNLRHKVELLLAKEAQAGSFLEIPAIEDMAVTLTAAESLLGRQFGPYHILSPLGAGGMGEVYRAHDSKLGRDVAIKTLPQEFAHDPERLSRLRREARTVASLNHPNIAAIYGLEESEEADYLVLELVEGETLRGPLPVQTALDRACQVAAALEAAHDKGIIHRDLKPANVKVTPQGTVKVLDFGLAKAIWGPEGNPELLQPGTGTGVGSIAGQIVGTPGYMSPEQARGGEVDKRTDIWAFGCLLYELLTGRRTFPGETQRDTIAAVLEREPDWRALPAKMPAAIRELLRHCLQKDAGRRLNHIADAHRTIEKALRGQNRWRVAAVAATALAMLAVGSEVWMGRSAHSLHSASQPTQIQALAVLPLVNLSGDPEQEYFADGMTEELINDLARIGALRVISRTSVMQYKDAHKSLPEIARSLNVDAVVEGSVERSGNRVRVRVQLIEAATDRHLSAESYERDLRDILGLQSEIAHAIADEIKIKLTPQDQTRLATTRPINSEAYESYLKGRYYWNKKSGVAVRQAAEYFSKAITLDGGYAAPYVGLADCYVSLSNLGQLLPSEAYGKAREAVLGALEIDDGLADAHASLAAIRADYDWDWQGAETEFQRALELDPKHANAHQWHAVFLARLGRFNEAAAEIRTAKELDPLSLPVATSAGLILRYARRYDEAIKELQKAIDLEPTFKFTHVELAEIYGLKGMFQEAAFEWSRVEALGGRQTPDYTAVRDAAGYQRSMQLWIERLREASNREYVSPMTMAIAYTRLGKAEQVIAWLEEAYRQRAPGLGGLKVDPLFDSLRSNPRFQDLLRRMNFPG